MKDFLASLNGELLDLPHGSSRSFIMIDDKTNIALLSGIIVGGLTGVGLLSLPPLLPDRLLVLL